MACVSPAHANEEAFVARQFSCDVVVVGAGLAGLRAATRLQQAGLSVQVLEARDRVGGKTWTITTHDTSIDIGGQWIGATQDRVLALVAELGLDMFESSIEYPLDRAGSFTVVLDGVPHAVRGFDVDDLTELPIRPETLQQWRDAMTELTRLAATVPPEAPWLTPWARRWDSMTLEYWMEQQMSDPLARALFVGTTLNELAASPVDISVLSMMHQLAMCPPSESSERWRIVGGAQQMSERMAAQLGDVVHLNDPVISVDWLADDVIVYTDLDGEYRAKRVIVALPPNLAGRLDYYPVLPVARESLTSRFPVGHVIKAQAVYERPFWRESGMNGYALIPQPEYISIIEDNSTPSAPTGVLVGFSFTDDAAVLADMPLADRRAQVLREFAAVFGPEALNPLDYIEGIWSLEQWSLGAWQCMPTPGAWTSYGTAWRVPVGPIHWAAADYADSWYGYFDGALRSGEDAAAAVLASLD